MTSPENTPDQSLVGFTEDLLSSMGDRDADSPLNDVNTEEPKIKFLPRYAAVKDRFTIKGKDGDIVRNDPEQPAVIHWAHPWPQRIFYKTEFDPKNPTPPDCGSNGAAPGEIERPDPSVANPMSDRCDTCEYNRNGCKLKQNIIVSEKITTGSAQLMLMTCNATSVFNTDGKSKGLLGLNDYLREVARTGKNLYNFVTKLSIWPDGNCMVKFSPMGVVTNPEDPNLIAHAKVRDSLDMAEICAMDFTPWEKEEDKEADTVEKPAPSAKVKDKAKPEADPTADAKIDAASDAIDDFLKGH